MVWSSYDISQDSQTDWLVRMYEKTVNGMRDMGGLPSEKNDSRVLTVEMPTLDAMAETMRYRDQMPPRHNIPSGVIPF